MCNLHALALGVLLLMKEEIIALRKRFVSMSVDTKNPDEVVQLNLQLFPLVKKKV